jgi:hypothetical protein
MNLKLICCEVFHHEISAAISKSKSRIDFEFMPKGLHDIGREGMLERIQQRLNEVDESKYDAVVFGYGLCNYGTAGLKARSIPLVIPRAHDCITLFLGSKERYLKYFTDHPGVYFKTTGWIEGSENSKELSQLSIQKQNGMDQTYEELVARYGEDNAEYLFKTLCDHQKNYGQYTFIEMGVEPNDSFKERTKKDAADRGWKFESIHGDLSLIQRMVDGIWDEKEFLVVPPGSKIVASYTDTIVVSECTKCSGCTSKCGR